MNTHFRKPLVILVVDDNVDAADCLTALLQRYGYQVASAHGGRAAVRMVEELLPNVVISDLEMPDMPGIDEAIAVRGLSLPTQPWMVAVTGSSQEEIERAALVAGFDFFLTKPTNLQTLNRMLEQVRRDGAR